MATEFTTLIQALEAELAREPLDYEFPAAELAMLDNLHTRGFTATVELAMMLKPDENTHVLDVGSGLGGPARHLAETYGCSVEGIDASAGLVAAANYLSSRWLGPDWKVHFAIGDALALPFEDESFDVVWMLHVAMNIEDRGALYREIRRVLRPGGRFLTYDVLQGNGDLVYPTPWAADAMSSTVLTGEQTRAAIESAGLRVQSFALDTPAALAWVRESAAAVAAGEGPAGAMMLRAALGENFRQIVGNLGKNYLEGRAEVGTIIAQRQGETALA